MTRRSRRYTPEELESIALGERYQTRRKRKPNVRKKKPTPVPRPKKAPPKKGKGKGAHKTPTKAAPKKSPSFGRKIYPSLPEKDNDRVRRLIADLAAAKAEVERLKKRKPPKPKPKPQPKEETALEKAKRLKRNVYFLKGNEQEVAALNDKLADINGQKIKAALSNEPNRLSRLAELEEEAIKLRRKRYRMTRPYFSTKLIEFREGHVNGIDSFIHACLSIGMSEREAYTLWYSPK